MSATGLLRSQNEWSTELFSWLLIAPRESFHLPAWEFQLTDWLLHLFVFRLAVQNTERQVGTFWFKVHFNGRTHPAILTHFLHHSASGCLVNTFSPQHHVCWESSDIISCGDPHVVLACVCVLIQTIAGHTWAPDTDQRTTKIREACSYIVNTQAPIHSETVDWIEVLIHRDGCNFLLQILAYTKRDS